MSRGQTSTMPGRLTGPAARVVVLMATLLAGSYVLDAQVTGDRLLRAASEPHNWLTYGGTLHESALQHARPDHAGERGAARIEVGGAEPGVRRLAVEPAGGRRRDVPDPAAQRRDGGGREDRIALLAVSATRRRPTPRSAAAPTTAASPSSAISSSWARSTRGSSPSTAMSGKARWNIAVGDVKAGYSITMAPLVIKDKVLVGVGGGEYGIRGFVAAYDAKTGKEVWKFYTIPGPGEPGHDTWEGDDWKTGGAPAWVTGSYDPALNLVYWGIGNPGPDWNPKQRPGDNLYSDSVIALDADTGEAEVALPVHAERSLRLRRRAGAGARRSHLEGPAPQADAVGQPQRLLLRARSRDRRVPAGHAVREGQLGQRSRRQGPAASRRRSRSAPPPIRAIRAAPTGTCPSLQSAHGPLLLLGVGELRHDLPARGVRPTRPGSSSPAAASAWSRRRPARPRSASAGAARSTTGPTKWATAP